MSVLKEAAERLEGKGWLGVGLGAVVLAPVLFPALSRGFRPAAKRAIKGYLALAEKAREMLAETGEQVQDLVAEARSEYERGDDGMEMMTLATAEAGAKGGETQPAAEAGEKTPARAKPAARRAPRRKPAESESA
jgi:hypothetical protein